MKHYHDWNIIMTEIWISRVSLLYKQVLHILHQSCLLKDVQDRPRLESPFMVSSKAGFILNQIVWKS
jgi:hypothetical protein